MSPTELAAVLEHARRRTETLLDPLPDEQLTRQVSTLQSPLVWDLAHIAYFEELWLLRGGNGNGLDDLYASPHGQEMQDTYEDRLKDNTRTPPADQAAFRIDFAQWLKTLSKH